MTKPRALDLFCAQGGATRGLQRAGFHVTGVDSRPQPRYCGDAFIQMDALEADCAGFDFIWASPPCQAFCSLRHMPTAKPHPNLIPQTRAKLVAAGIPYSIENVENAPLKGNLIMLCGTMFGLQTADGRAELRRHRLFETSFSITLSPQCRHGAATIGTLSVAGDYAEVNANRKRVAAVLTITGHTPVDNRRPTISVIGHSAPGMHNSRGAVISVAGTGLGRRRAITVTGSTPPNTINNFVRETFSVEQAREAMGIDWMTMAGLSQAIPPAYAEYIGLEAIALCRGRAEA